MQNITPVHCFYVVFYILEFFPQSTEKKIIKKTSICQREVLLLARCRLCREYSFSPPAVSATPQMLCFPLFRRLRTKFLILYITSIFLLNGLTSNSHSSPETTFNDLTYSTVCSSSAHLWQISRLAQSRQKTNLLSRRVNNTVYCTNSSLMSSNWH